MKKKTKIVGIISCVFFIYCIYLLIKILANPTDTFIVENGKIYKEETVEGYIIRDEEVIQNGDSGGKIVQLKAEGKKVANGEAIYRYTLENEDEINEQIDKLDIQIQEALKNESTLFSTDIKLLEKHIEDKFELVYENTDIKAIEQYKKDISNDINKKAKIAGSLTANDSYVKKLIEQKSEYEKQLNANSKYVYSGKSGIISYKVDDFENKLVTGDFGYLNKDFLESLNLRSGQIIATTSNKAKIVSNFHCYITCISKSEEARKSEVGNKLKLRLQSSEEISAEIVHKSDCGNNEVLLVFKIEQSVEKLINYRKINFDIIWWSDSGLKVPINAIKYEGDFAYVIRNKAGYEEKIIVKVLRKNDNFAIVENYSTTELEKMGYDLNALDGKKSISLYDEIVINKDKK